MARRHTRRSQPPAGADRIAWFTERLRDFGAVLWLCLYPIGCTLAGLAALLWLDQGHEVLVAIRESAVHGRGAGWFFVAISAWALSAWWCARVLLNSPIVSGRLEHSPSAFVRWLRVWLPRLLGLIAIVPLAFKYLLLFQSWFPALPLLLLAAGFWVVAVRRRRWVNRWLDAARTRRWLPARTRTALRLPPVTQVEPRVRRSTLVVCVAALALSFLLVLWFVVSPVEAPRRLGAAAIALLALSSWIVFGSIVLVLWPRLKGLPSLALLPLVTATLASAWNDNDGLRRLESAAGAPPVCSAGDCVTRAFVDWYRTRAPRPDGKVPVFVIAAAGGGQRAAYWTGHALALLDDVSGGEFSRHVFAVSGVSGGSLGATTFAALAAQKSSGRPAAACAREFLSEDFLAPTLAYLLFPDLLQQVLIPFPVPAFDRARALEASWERSWQQVVGGEENLFAASFDALWAGERRQRVPALFLNATVVESGRRIIASPIAPGINDFTDAEYLFDPALRTWPLPLSTATHLSARFAYISPAATVRSAATDRKWGRIVDGAYYESSGAMTAAEILRAIELAIQRGEVPADRLELFVILLTNSASEPRLCIEGEQAAPAEFLHEARAPLQALLMTREARGTLSRAQLAGIARRLASPNVTCNCFDGGWCNVFEIAMAGIREEPRFGWFLSEQSRRAMNEALLLGENREALKGIAAVVLGRAPQEGDLAITGGTCRQL
jgi:predicted acylesterase/phospholipase RssA